MSERTAVTVSVVALTALSLTARWWVMPFLSFLDVNAAVIQSLDSLIQIVLWVIGTIAIVFGIRWFRRHPEDNPDQPPPAD